MATPSPHPPEILCREILDEARRQAETIISLARAKAAARVAQAEAEVQRVEAAELASAHAEAQRRQEALLATLPVETGRLWSARMETLLESIHETARERLRRHDGEAFRKAIVRLAVEALGGMDSDAFRLRVSPVALRALGETLVEEIRQRASQPTLALELVEEGGLQDGEIVLEDREGRQRWDLAPEARLERLWAELRRGIVARTGLGERTSSKEEAS